MPRPKGSKNRATIAAQAAFREQIIKEHQANQAAEKPPEAPPTLKEVAAVTVQRETLDLGVADDKADPIELADSVAVESIEPCEADEETLDLEPPPPPPKKQVRMSPSPSPSVAPVKPKSSGLDKPAATPIVRKPETKPSKPSPPPKTARLPSWRLGSRGT